MYKSIMINIVNMLNSNRFHSSKRIITCIVFQNLFMRYKSYLIFYNYENLNVITLY
jgi:hypothetical protein